MRTVIPGILYLVVPLLILVTGCSKDDAGGSLAQNVTSDLSYGPHPQQKMDVYLPANRSAETPLIIFLHGGGFIGGDKKEVSDVAQIYLDLGYAVANINYRLIDTAGLFREPMVHQLSNITIAHQLDDIAVAIDKIGNMANEWRINSSKWAIAGHSAGATLALLYAHGAHNTPGRIKAAVNFAGAITFAYNDESEVAQQDPRLIEVLYRATGKEATNANKLHYMAISPYWVSNNTSSKAPVHNIRPSADSGHDLYVGYTNMLTNKNIANQYNIIDNASHGFTPEGKWLEAINGDHEFLKKHGF